MDKTCKDGYRWCPIMKKCMPPDHFKGKGKGMHKGQGEGPIGQPTKEANELVDVAFDEGFEIFGKLVKAQKKLDQLLDCMMGGGPFNKGIADPESEEEYEDAYDALPNDGEKVGPNDISHVPDQDGNALYKAIRRQLGEWKMLNEDGREAYKKYFDGMLKKFGVSSPAQLDDEKKKAFFNAVDKGWKTKKES